MAGNRDYGLFKVICKLHVCLPFVTHLLQSPSTAVGFQTVYWCQGISCNIHVYGIRIIDMKKSLNYLLEYNKVLSSSNCYVISITW